MTLAFEPRPFCAACRPPFWAKGGHAQTIWGHLLQAEGLGLEPDHQPQNGVRAADYRVDLGDGDALVASELKHPNPRAAVHLFHGLSGDTTADYMRLAALAAWRSGCTVLATNHRGCGRGRGLAAKSYHSGSSEDLAMALEAGRKRHPDLAHFAIGFSLSANALLLLLAENLGPAPAGVIAVNPPVDLESTSLRMHAGFNRVYEQRFVKRLRESLQQRFLEHKDGHEYVIPPGATLWDVDEIVTAHSGGFKDARDYYQQCSTHKRLSKISIPTVILGAADDPIVDVACLRRARLSASTYLHIEPSGGHIGYLTRSASGLGAKRWLPEFLEHMLGELLRSHAG